MDIKDIADELFKRIAQNEANYPAEGYGKGYADGYHDALIEMLDYFSIPHDEEFQN